LAAFGDLCSFLIRKGASSDQWSFFFVWGGFSSRWWFVLGRSAFGNFYLLVIRWDGFDGMSFVLGWSGFVGKSFVLGWGAFAKMDWEDFHSLSQAQFALVLCNVFMLQFNSGNYWNKWDLSWTKYKKT
jgi:hypothetical protein